MPNRFLVTAAAFLFAFGPAMTASALERKAAMEPEPYDKAWAAYANGDIQAALQPLALLIQNRSRMVPARALSARIAHVYEDYDTMRDEARRVLQDFMPASRRPDDHAARGTAYLYLGQPKKAVEEYDQAMKLSKRSATLLAARSQAWRATGYLHKAFADVDEAILKAPRTPLYRLYRAQYHQQAGEYGKAIHDLTAALRVNRKFSLAYGLLGSALAGKGDLGRAVKAYDKALELWPEYAYPMIGRAMVELARGDGKQALAEVDRVLSDRPRHFNAVFNKGEILWSLGKRDEAMETFRQALGCEMPDAAHAALLGEKLASALLWRESVEAYTAAYSLSPDPDYLAARAKAYSVLTEYEPAMKDLDAAVEAEPATARFWAARGTLAAKMGLETKALENLSQAYKLEPKNPEVLMAKGALMSRLGRPEEAAKEYGHAINLDPGSADAYNSRAVLYANAIGDLDKALMDIERAVELRPKDPVFRYNLGVIRLKRREFFKAITTLTQALSLRGPPSRILQMRADAYAQVGNITGAMDDMQVVLDREQGSAAVYDTLGAIKLRVHDYESAAADLTRALEFNAKSADARLHRGLAYGGMGELKRAGKDFEQLLEENPGSKEALTHLCWDERLRGDPGDGLRLCNKALDIDPEYAPAQLHKGLCLVALKEPHKAIELLHRAEAAGLRSGELLLARALAHTQARQYRQAHLLYQRAIGFDPDARSPEIGFGAVHGKTDDYFVAIQDLHEDMEDAPPGPYLFLVRGDGFHSAGQFEKAVMEYTKALEMDGTLADAFVARAEALIAQNALEAAWRDLKAALDLEPKDGRNLVRLSQLHVARRDYPAALKTAAEAVKGAPEHVEARLQEGNVHYFMRKYDKALKSFQKAAELDPGDPNAANGIGLAYFALKKNAEALEHFSKAIALDPNSDRFYRNRGSTYTKLGDFANAASDFGIARLVSTDPVLIEEYDKLVSEARARVPASDR